MGEKMTNVMNTTRPTFKWNGRKLVQLYHHTTNFHQNIDPEQIISKKNNKKDWIQLNRRLAS